MSRDSIDKWLDAIQFEIFRLSPRHHPLSPELLESRIKQLESMPVTEGAGNDLHEKFHQLKCLQEDLQSLRAMRSWLQKVAHLKDRVQEKGLVDCRNEVVEAFDELDILSEKKKIEQRERQRQHLASLRQLWPNADGARKRRMVELLATYARRRLMTGTVNSLRAVPFKIARWAARGIKGRPGL